MGHCIHTLAHMAFTFIGLSLLWLAGFQACRALGARADWQTNVWIDVGAGFFIAAALLILFLTGAPVPLSTASWGAVFGCALIALPLLRSAMHPNRFKAPVFHLASVRAHLPHLLIIMLITGHLLLVLTNNLSRDIYPWDAFTTWMYRAKVWVLNNALVDFHTVDQWLRSGGTGYALHAAHYPASVSAVAAFASALSGGWSDHAASLTWFFATLAIGSLMYGLCRHAGYSGLLSLIATYALISIPLVSMHGALAGYADLWMLGTSGMGLAALLLWAQQPGKGLPTVGTALLLVGCFIKTEGWIWLGLGLLFITLLALWKRYRFKAIAGCAAVLLLCVALESAHLGLLGIWGVREGAIHVGPLGSYALRPYNPLPNYFEMIFIRGTFHLLGLFYLAALAVLTLRKPRACATHWLMGGLVIASQGVIFGVSNYSLYAETGTSINRLLLHFLPVFVLTGMAGLQSIGELATQNASVRDSRIKRLFTRITAATVAVLVGITAAVLIDRSSNSEDSPTGFYATETLVPVLGNLRQADDGRQQFTDTPGPVAVAKVQLKKPDTVQPRYVVTNVKVTKPEAVSFYWITKDDPQVQSYSLDVSGPTILDMKPIAAYWRQPITEMGYLVDKQSLGDVQVGNLQATDILLPEALPAVLNHWATPDVISQRSINMVDGHLPSPVSWGKLQSATLVLAGLLALLFAVIGKSAVHQVAASCMALAAVLWLVSDVISLRQLALATHRLAEGEMGTGRHMKTGTGASLTEIVEAIPCKRDSEAGVISIALDQSGEFQAQKLPLLLAPRSSVSVSLATGAQLSDSWQGHFAVFSDDQATIAAAVNKLKVGTNTRIIGRGEDYVILAPNSP